MQIRSTLTAVTLAVLSLQTTAIAQAKSETSRIIYQDVSAIIEELQIPEPATHLVAMATTPDDQHRAFMFSDNHQVKIYRDTALIYTGPLSECATDPYLFWMTPDGNVVSVPDCQTLYFNDQVVSKNNDVLLYGKEAAIYLNGSLLYPEGTAVKSFDPQSKTSTTLYENAREKVQYIRANTKAIAYSTENIATGAYSLYVQGNKVSPKPITNMTNFALSPSGDVYYFVASNNQKYTIYKNTKPYLTNTGIGGFLHLDNKNTLWHVSYRLTSGSKIGRLSLLKGTSHKNHLPTTAKNLEGFMAFQQGSYALRVQRWSEFYLFKNGQFEGTSFEFSSTGAHAGKKDYNGLFFAPDGSVFMRNYSQGNWYAFRDGQMLTDHEFQNVWYVHLDTHGRVQIYGTK